MSLSTVKNYIYASKLKTLKTPGRHHRIRKSDLLAALGERNISIDHGYGLSLARSLCYAMLSMFRSLGAAGDLFILHSRRVSALCRDTARIMSMSEKDIGRADIAGLIHDIGHVGIDRNILLKPAKLDKREYESIKMHPVTGEDILKSVELLRDIWGIVVQHHERMDGAGYPAGLSGENIQGLARIISVAEAYDSMVSSVPYKDNMSKKMAVDELMRYRGSQFDSNVVEAFIKVI